MSADGDDEEGEEVDDEDGAEEVASSRSGGAANARTLFGLNRPAAVGAARVAGNAVSEGDDADSASMQSWLWSWLWPWCWPWSWPWHWSSNAKARGSVLT